MTYLQMKYCNWDREECYGMFDYSESNIKYQHKLTIKQSCFIYRHKNTFELLCYDPDSKKKSKIDIMEEDYEKILKVQESYSNFNIHQIGKAQCFSRIISSSSKGYSLCQNETIRLGKTYLQIAKIVWRKPTQNIYDRVKNSSFLVKPSNQITDSFYSQPEQMSMLEENPACRYCYAKTIDKKNPFLTICNCSGHTKYIHKECLVEWIKKRNNGNGDIEVKTKGIYCIKAKAFVCELCHQEYIFEELINQTFDLDEKNRLQQYAIFQVTGNIDLIYIVDLSCVQEIIVGRSLENGIVIQDLSVSRRHCKLVIDPQKKVINLFDQGSKFGSVINIQKAEIKNKHEFQKGRTKMQVQRFQKRGIFEKLGFCSFQENSQNGQQSLY